MFVLHSLYNFIYYDYTDLSGLNTLGSCQCMGDLCVACIGTTTEDPCGNSTSLSVTEPVQCTDDLSAIIIH